MTFNEASRNRRSLYILCSKLVGISEFVGDEGRSVCCPFHDDSRPSAKVFKDKDSVERLFCYSCNRQFTSFDYIEKVEQRQVKDFLLERYSLQVLDELTKQFDLNPPKREIDNSLKEALSTYLKSEDLESLLLSYYKPE